MYRLDLIECMRIVYFVKNPNKKQPIHLSNVDLGGHLRGSVTGFAIGPQSSVTRASCVITLICRGFQNTVMCLLKKQDGYLSTRVFLLTGVFRYQCP